MALVLTVTQQVTYAVEFKDAKGNPAMVDGVPEWKVGDETVLDVEPSADGMSCLVKALGPVGTSQLSVTADADLGAGIVPVIGVDQISVVAGQAVSAGMTAGTPEEQATPKRGR
jgi:hypothetical protein